MRRFTVRTPQPTPHIGVISAIRTWDKWVILTSHHLAESFAPDCWSCTRWVPIAMVTLIELRRRIALLWALISAMLALLLCVQLLDPHCLDPFYVEVTACLFPLSLVTFLTKSGFRAVFAVPGCEIVLRVPLSRGWALSRFCSRVLECQRRLAGAGGDSRKEAEEPRRLPQRRWPQVVEHERSRASTRRTLSPARWH